MMKPQQLSLHRTHVVDEEKEDPQLQSAAMGKDHIPFIPPKRATLAPLSWQKLHDLT